MKIYFPSGISLDLALSLKTVYESWFLFTTFKIGTLYQVRSKKFGGFFSKVFKDNIIQDFLFWNIWIWQLFYGQNKKIEVFLIYWPHKNSGVLSFSCIFSSQVHAQAPPTCSSHVSFMSNHRPNFCCVSGSVWNSMN